MAEKRSLKNCFTSRYGGGFINAAQFLAEYVCERMAKRKGVDLPHKFWQSSAEWKKAFLYQVQLAHRLLKLYRLEAILAALRENKTVYSLNAQFIDSKIKDEQAKLVAIELKLQETPAVVPPPSTLSKPRPSVAGKPSTLSKLRGLDG